MEAVTLICQVMQAVQAFAWRRLRPSEEMEGPVRSVAEHSELRLMPTERPQPLTRVLAEPVVEVEALLDWEEWVVVELRSLQSTVEMKIAHWTLFNQSGMNGMAATICAAERVLGLDSILVNCTDAAAWAAADNADVHCVHTHISDAALQSGKPLVWFAHGTPEVMFHSGYEQGLVNGAYGHGDAWMMAQYWLQHCDVTVTFWPRHQKIWKSLADKKTPVECVPMGIEKALWNPVPSAGKFNGTPSLITAENAYEIKWPLDLFIAWPWVTKEIHAARLHALYVPKDQHRWWFPLVNRNGCSFHAHIGPQVFGRDQLRNAFCSTDFFIGLVRYGDHNRLGLEANACGARTISYAGNPYSDFWVTEGDQRIIADQLVHILKGEVPARNKEPVADISETAKATKSIYESL